MMIRLLSVRKLFREKRWLRFCLWTIVSFVLFFLLLTIVFRPSHNREWELGQETLPYIHMNDEGIATIEGFRNFNWQDELLAIPRYETH